MATLTQIYDWFMTGKKPTQAQFWAAWGSFRHKEEAIPQSAVSNLENTLNAKAEKSQYDAHLIDPNAHADLLFGKEDKTQKGVAGGYVPLDEFSKIAHQFLSIVNNLTTGGTTSLLSAEQGVVLQTKIDAINTLLTSNDINLDTVQEIVDAIKTVETSLETILVNDLTTGGTTKALTAEMGKTLKGLIDDLQDNVTGLPGELASGNIIDFKNITGKIYNKNIPVSGNITLDFSDAIIGAVSCIFHSSSFTPVINNGVIFSGGKYLVNQINLLWFTYIGGNKVIMSIQNMTALDIPSSFLYTILSSTSVKFTWTNTAGVVLQRSVNSDFSEATTIYTGNLYEYTDTVTAGTYYYRLKSIASGSVDSPYVNLLVSTYIASNLTFNAGPKNLLTNPTGNIWSTSSGVSYESYGNSDFKFPANTLSWIQINTPSSSLEGSIIGLATSNTAGNYSVTKFAIQTGTGTTSLAKFLNGVYVPGEIASGYYAGANAKLRLLREVSGLCKVYKSSDGLTYELVYTFTESYTGELWLIINPKNSSSQINNPVGLNLIAK